MVFALSLTAMAKDAISASVSNFDLRTPTVTVNGNPYSHGTFAVGTIQLFYEVNQFQFTAGTLARFDLALQDIKVSTTGQAPNYPVGLNVAQIGSTNVGLSPSPASFSVIGVGWSGVSTVTVSIPVSVANNPAFAVDGTELVGNMKLSTVPAGSKLDTVTNVQVHVRLVHPTSCIRVFDFMTSQDLVQGVTQLPVNLWKNGPNQDKTKSTDPPQLSNNVLIVNTCSSNETFDLTIQNDPSFEDQGANAVQMFTKTGPADPSTFDITQFGTGTPKGQLHCFGSITLAGNNTLLTTDHMSLATLDVSQLPAGSFTFSVSVGTAGSGCPGTPNTLASPNPATLSIPYSIQ